MSIVIVIIIIKINYVCEGERERGIKFNTRITNTTPNKSAHMQTDSPLLDSDTSLAGEIGSDCNL